jgi:hypothetical protein
MSFSDDPTQGTSSGPDEDPAQGAMGAESSGDPSQGTEQGATSAEDPSAGNQAGEQPDDDPSEGREVGAEPGEDPTM